MHLFGGIQTEMYRGRPMAAGIGMSGPREPGPAAAGTWGGEEPPGGIFHFDFFGFCGRAGKSDLDFLDWSSGQLEHSGGKCSKPLVVWWQGSRPRG